MYACEFIALAQTSDYHCREVKFTRRRFCSPLTCKYVRLEKEKDMCTTLTLKIPTRSPAQRRRVLRCSSRCSAWKRNSQNWRQQSQLPQRQRSLPANIWQPPHIPRTLFSRTVGVCWLRKWLRLTGFWEKSRILRGRASAPSQTHSMKWKSLTGIALFVLCVVCCVLCCVLRVVCCVLCVMC